MGSINVSKKTQSEYRLRKGIVLEKICNKLEKMFINNKPIKEIKKYLYNESLKIDIRIKDKIWENLMTKYNCTEKAIKKFIEKKAELEFHKREFGY